MAETPETKVEIEVEKPESKTPKRDKFMQRFGDRQFADDEELFGQIEDDYAGAEENKNTINSLNEMLSANPRSATFLASLVNGEDPVITYLEEYGQDSLEELQTEEGKKKAAEAHDKYLKKVADSKEIDKQYADNILKSQEIVDQYRNEGKDVDAALDLLDKAYKGILTGEITAEMLDMALNSVNYANDVAAAGTDGEIRGRNEQIAKKVKSSKNGDGLPNVGGGSKPAPTAEEKNYGALSSGASRPSIWDRG